MLDRGKGSEAGTASSFDLFGVAVTCAIYPELVDLGVLLTCSGAFVALLSSETAPILHMSDKIHLGRAYFNWRIDQFV